MIIAALKTIDKKDQRSVIHPDTIQSLVNLEAQIYCESGICDGININDDSLKNKEISEDEVKTNEKVVQEFTDKNIKIIDEIIFDKLTNEIKDLDVIYPSVGENLSFLKIIKKKKNLNYNFIVRDGDEFCWQFSNKGYFNFKSNIPKIIQKIT